MRQRRTPRQTHEHHLEGGALLRSLHDLIEALGDTQMESKQVVGLRALGHRAVKIGQSLQSQLLCQRGDPLVLQHTHGDQHRSSLAGSPDRVPWFGESCRSFVPAAASLGAGSIAPPAIGISRSILTATSIAEAPLLRRAKSATARAAIACPQLRAVLAVIGNEE